MKSIAVIAAHPDDEVLGCGASIARECDRGARVSVLIAATGKSSRYAAVEDAPPEEIKQLYAESRRSLGILGVQPEDIHFGGFPDQRLDVIPLLDIVQWLQKVLNDLAPNVIYTHHYGDYNRDHTVVHDATMVACRPYLGEVYPQQIYAYEVLSSTEWAGAVRSPFRPMVYHDVADSIERKKEAMAAYESELRPYPHPRSVKGVEALAMKRGNEVSIPWAEAFELIRDIS
ncbi:MAG: PIG-L deacetylase family protein [Fibrobacterota bacterium]